MKTLLIILNLAGGQPIVIDYADAPACERAAVVANKAATFGGFSSQLSLAYCIPAQ